MLLVQFVLFSVTLRLYRKSYNSLNTEVIYAVLIIRGETPNYSPSRGKYTRHGIWGGVGGTELGENNKYYILYSLLKIA